MSNVAKEHGAQSPKGAVIQFPLTHEDLSFLTGAHRVLVKYREQLGDAADSVSMLWRTKQLEYTWLRSLMKHH